MISALVQTSFIVSLRAWNRIEAACSKAHAHRAAACLHKWMPPHLPLMYKLPSWLHWVHRHTKIAPLGGVIHAAFYACTPLPSFFIYLWEDLVGLNVISICPSTKPSLLKMSFLLTLLIAPCSLPSCFLILYLLMCLLVYCLHLSSGWKLHEAEIRTHSPCPHLQIPSIETRS